jgi:hypothetical protein
MRKSQTLNDSVPDKTIVARRPLNQSEILDLERALMDVFQVVSTYRRTNPVAKHIKFPPMPSILSESIAIAATPLLFGRDWEGRYGGRVCDVSIENSVSRAIRRVEVKATGHHAFQELKEKDLQADALIWIRFGQRFENGNGRIEISVLDTPGSYFKRQCRLDARRFEATPGVSANQRIFGFESIEQLLADSAAASDHRLLPCAPHVG